MPEHEVDLDKATTAVADLLDALGVDRTADGLAATPARVARAYGELLSPEPFHVTTFANDEGYDELVVARAIPFASLCEHHLLPFTGFAYVGYLPDERLLGLSKLAPVVDHFSRRLQVQERLTAQVANFIAETVASQGGRRRPRGRTPLHVAARCPGWRLTDRDLRTQGSRARRPSHAVGVPRPDRNLSQ